MTSTIAKSITKNVDCSVPANTKPIIDKFDYTPFLKDREIKTKSICERLVRQREIALYERVGSLVRCRIKQIEAEEEEKRTRTLELINIGIVQAHQIYYDQAGLFGGNIPSEKKDYQGFLGGINRVLYEGLTVNHKVDDDSISRSAQKIRSEVEDSVSEVKDSFVSRFVPSADGIKQWTTPLSIIAFCLAAIQWYRNGKFKQELFVAAIALLLPEAYSAIKPYIIRFWQAMVKSVNKESDASESNDKKVKEEKESTEELYSDQAFELPDFSSFSICPSTIKVLSGAIAGIVLGFVIKDARGLSQTVDRLTKLKDFPNLSNGLYGIFDWMVTAVEAITNWFRGLFKMDKWFFWTSEYPEAEKNIKDGYASISKYTVKERLSLDDIRYLDKLHNALQKNEIELPKKANRELVLIANLKRAMVPLMQRVRRTNVQGSGGRVSPVSILLCGESAIGKSSAQIAFAKAVCTLLLPKERMEMFMNDPSEEIYARNTQSDFWEGYRSQFMIWYDDLGFMKAIAGQSSAESEMIPVKNEIPFMPNMAFGDKGKVFLNSDVILGTSNFVKFVPENLAYPEAFINRWDMVYVVTVDPNSPHCANPDEKNPMRRTLKKGIEDVIPWYEHLIFVDFDIRGFHRAQKGALMNRNAEDPSLAAFLGKHHSFKDTVYDFVDKYRASRSKSIKLLSHQKEIINHFLKVRNESGEIPEQFVEGSDITPIPGGVEVPLMVDQNGTPDLIEHEYEIIEKKIRSMGIKSNIPKEIIRNARIFQQGLKMSNSAFVDGEAFYRVKKRDRPDNNVLYEAYEKDRNIIAMKKREFVEDDSCGSYCMETLDMILGDDYNFEHGICPLMSNDPSLVVTPLGAIPGVNRSLESIYFTNYYLALQSDREKCIKILKQSSSDGIKHYPSLQNPLFSSIIDIGITDRDQECSMSELGTFLGSIVRLSQLRRSEKMYRAKRAFKTKLYEMFSISKGALREFLCPTNILKNLWSVVKNAALVIATLVAGGYLVKGISEYTNLLPIFDDKPKDESNSNINIKELKSHRKPIKDRNMRSMVNQSAYNENTRDNYVSQIMSKIHRRNAFIMSLGKVMFGTVTFIMGHYAIMPKHFKENIDQALKKGNVSEENPIRCDPFDAKIVDGKVVGGFSFFPREEMFHVPLGDLKEQDVILVNFSGTGHQPCSPIVDHFISIDDLADDEYAFHGTLYRIRGVGKMSEKEVDLRILENVKCKAGVRNKYSWRYHGDTQSGDCGSLLAIHNSKIPKRKIAGFHTQGKSDGMSTGPVIFKEYLEEELDLIDDYYNTRLQIGDIDTEDLNEDMNYISLWKEKDFIEVPRYNPIQKSPLNGKVTPVSKIPTDPRIYIDESGRKVDPCVTTLNKATPDNVLIHNDIVNIIVEERYKRDKRLAPIESQGTGRIYSVEEACAGIEGDPLLKALPRGSSAGHDKNIIAAKNGGGKYLWFGKGDTFSFDNDYFKQLKAEVLDIIYYSNLGIRYTFIYYCFPKFETLNIEDVRERKKVRMIYGGPLNLSVTYRCLYMEFNKYIIQNRIYNGFAAGIDEHSSEWDTIGKLLEKLNIIVGDHKGYDFKNKSQMLAASAYHANLYYNDKYTKAREIIAIEAHNAKILFEGMVYDKTDGLGSGFSGTLFFNGESNQNTIIYSSCKIVFPDLANTPRETLRTFIAELLFHNYLIVQGDDFAYGVHDRFKGIITFHTLRQRAKEIGYDITPADKSDSELAPDYTPIDKVTFLKRQFRLYKGKYIAPLDMESIDNMIQWVSKKKYNKADFEQVLETYLGELSLYGPEVFRTKFQRLLVAARDARLTWTPKFFNQMDYLESMTSDRRFRNMSVADVWDYVALHANRLEKIDKEYIDDRSLQHWRQKTMMEVDDAEEFMTDESNGFEVKMAPGMKNTLAIEAFLASITLQCYKERFKTISILRGILEEEPKKKNRKARKKERKLSRDLNLPAASSLAETEITPEGNVKTLTPSELFEDQSNMTSTTANTHDDIPELNHSPSATVSKSTTEFLTSTENNFVLTNDSLENKLRKVIHKQNDIKEFFEKKKEIGSFTWATSDAIGTLLATYDVDAILTSTAMWSDKYRGFLNFRGNAVLTLQVNATPFHAGIFRVVWKPYVANDNDWAAFNRLHSISTVQLSQLPGIYHQVSTDTCQMKAPIIGPRNCKTLGGEDTLWNYGFFEVYVFAPLDTGAADSITVRSFLSFEEVDIDTPWYNQAGENPALEEKKAKGIVSSAADNLIPVVRNLSSIPFLTNVTGPAEWVLKAIKGGAEAVGWSKPTLTDTMSRMYNNNMSYALNTNGVDPSTVLALDATNACTALAKSSIYSPMDEMSINFIKTQPAYWTNVNWTTGNVNGDLLASWDHRASAYTQVGSFPTATGSISTYYMTPVCFVANLFKYWRSDIEFKLVFSKTGYHSGSFAITYVPGDSAGGLTYANSQYNFREIVDIQTCEEYCFNVPYESPDPYKHYLTKAGTIYLHVVTPLKAPASVAQGINIMVIVQGSKNGDFQFPLQKIPEVAYFDQGGDVTNEGCEEANILNNEDNLSIAYSALCIGENIRSIKQLLEMYTFININHTNPNWTTPMTGAGYKEVFLRPLDVHVTRYAKTAGVYAMATTFTYLTDKFSTLASCYLYMRGSMRYAYTSSSADVSVAISEFVPNNTAPFAGPLTGPAGTALGLGAYINSFASFNNTDNTAMIKDPYYNKFPLTLTVPNYLQTQGWATRYGNDHSISISSNTNIDFQGNTGYVQRAVGDDFQLSFWLGVPTLIIK